MTESDDDWDSGGDRVDEDAAHRSAADDDDLDSTDGDRADERDDLASDEDRAAQAPIAAEPSLAAPSILQQATIERRRRGRPEKTSVRQPHR